MSLSETKGDKTMQLQHTSEQNIEVIQLPSRILMADAKQTKKSLHNFVNQQQPRIALDMRQVEFIDSSGLAVLVNCLQTCRRKSGDICLFGLRDTVKTLFELTRLNTIFPIEDFQKGAIERLAV
jgi:anti-sigma B factor antagonist